MRVISLLYLALETAIFIIVVCPSSDPHKNEYTDCGAKVNISSIMFKTEMGVLYRVVYFSS